MTREYSTDAVVLGSRKLGEADRIVDLFTDGRGRVPTVVKGVRKVGSRWGGRLEPFTLLRVQMHEGRSLHTLTGADTVKTHAPLRGDPVFLKAGLSVVEMISRSTPELHRKPRTYNLFLRFLEEMEKACSGSLKVVDDNSGAVSALILALAAQLKVLLLAGFLPHLLGCAHCGSEGMVVSFSARAGGALCAGCKRDGFPVLPESLEGMRFLLENPLLAAHDVKIEDGPCRQIRRSIKEICEYHLGVRLKVEPW